LIQIKTATASIRIVVEIIANGANELIELGWRCPQHDVVRGRPETAHYSLLARYFSNV
jgi:hypothetical protein